MLFNLGFDLAHAISSPAAEEPTCTLVMFRVGDEKRVWEDTTDVPIESGPKFS